MAADDHNDGQGGATDNVIRFPRDWVDKDKLVPFGPAADRLERERAQDLSDALSADDFWGGGSGALHQAVDLPERPAEEADEPVALLAEPISPAATDDPWWAQTVSGLPRREWRFVPRVRRPPVRFAPPPAAVLVVAMLCAASVLFVLQLPGSGSSGERHRLSSYQARAAAGANMTAPVVPGARTGAGFSAGAVGAAVLADGHRAAQLASRALVRRRIVHRSRSHHARHVSRGRAHPSTRPTRVVVPAPSASTVTGGGSSVTSSGPVSAPAPAVSAPAVSTPAPASSATPAGSGSSGSVSSSQFGGVVGSNCNPNCR